MKVRVQYTVEVSDEYRTAINQYHGLEGKATRKDVRDFLYLHGVSMDDDIMDSLVDDDSER
jgi:hypothetical protein